MDDARVIIGNSFRKGRDDGGYNSSLYPQGDRNLDVEGEIGVGNDADKK